MARLNKATRENIGSQIEAQLPGHWRITVGAEGYAFIEVDQDGKKPAHEFHAIGSAVIVIGNANGGCVEANRYERVPHPPGYIEGRQHHSVITIVNGRGWVGKLVEAVVAAAAEADVRINTADMAEA